MAKLEEVTTFNLDGKTYAVASLTDEAKDLLSIYLETEEDIRKLKVNLVKSQHALASMGSMFRDMIKDVEPLPLEEIAARQAAEAAQASATPVQPEEPQRVKRVRRR